ncbi:MAG: mannose-1-phosphate guanylyltransferase/mannose-6-phosphate isomerase [Stappiaceae bacterium]
MIFPTILSGGFGSRLWPLSRRARPKQFLKLFGSHSLFQKTCKRVDGEMFAPPLVISNQEHRFLIGEQLSEISIPPQAIVLEPIGRNTAAPAALAALMAEIHDPDALVLLLPSDHLMTDPDAFLAAVAQAEATARSGAVVTFGITPDIPHTGYGYIRLGDTGDDVKPVEAFVEKPNAHNAQKFLDQGNHVWNAGIFLFSASHMLAAFRKHAPEVLSGVEAALEHAKQDLDFLRLDEENFKTIQDISFDYAIMEKISEIACIPMNPGWSDLGSWSAIWEALEKDHNQNSHLGEAHFFDSGQCLSISDDAAVFVLGLDDVMIINTPDALLVAHKNKAQDVKEIVKMLDAVNRPETVEHRRRYRPWGWTERINAGDRFKAHAIMIKPGASLSMQRHLHRAEHWIVVNGTLEVTIDGIEQLLSENQSIFVPLGSKHKLANRGRVPARLIEIQTGSYIEEDDVVRE